jgi:hypothetical protein
VDADAQFEGLLVEVLERHPHAYMRLSDLLLAVWEGCLTPLLHDNFCFNWRQARKLPHRFRPANNARAIVEPKQIGKSLVGDLAWWLQERPRFQVVGCRYAACTHPPILPAVRSVISRMLATPLIIARQGATHLAPGRGLWYSPMQS